MSTRARGQQAMTITATHVPIYRLTDLTLSRAGPACAFTVSYTSIRSSLYKK